MPVVRYPNPEVLNPQASGYGDILNWFERHLEEVRSIVTPINLASGTVNLQAYPLPGKLEEVLGSITKLNGYVAPLGPESLRRKIADWENSQAENNVYSSTNVGVFPGSVATSMKHVLKRVLSAREGKEVVLPVPSYWLVPEILSREIPEAQLTTVEGQGAFLSVEEIAGCITPRTAVLSLAYPNNPTGSSFTDEELEYLVQVARQNNCWVFCDEVSQDLTFGTHKHPNIANFGYDKVVRFKSISKTLGLPTLLVGYALGPSSLLEGRDIGVSYGHPGKFGCTVYETYIDMKLQQDQELLAFEQGLSATYQRIATQVENILDKTPVTMVKPRGGFSIFLKFPGYVQGTDLAKELFREKGVSTIPGELFCLYDGSSAIRINTCTFEKQVTDAVERIADYSMKYADAQEELLDLQR